MSESPLLPTESATPVLADEAPKACAQCGSIHLSTLTQLPVCEPCRMALVRFPFPLWVKLAASFVAVMVVVSLAMSQERISKRLHLVHAKNLLCQEKWEQAYEEYRSLSARHTDTETLLSYAEAAMHSGHLQEAAQTMQKLSGRQALRAELVRANTINDGLQAAARRAGTQQAWPGGGTQPGRGSSLNGFQLQQTPSPQPMPGSLNLNTAPIRLQTR